MLADQQNDELNKAPVLKSMSRNEPFNAPPGYFEAFSSDLQDKIALGTPNSSRILIFRPAFLIAAVIVVIMAGGLYFNLHREVSSQQEIACTFDDLIESGFYSELDENLLADQLADAPRNNSISDNAIEDYLINNSDESLLTDTL